MKGDDDWPVKASQTCEGGKGHREPRVVNMDNVRLHSPGIRGDCPCARHIPRGRRERYCSLHRRPRIRVYSRNYLVPTRSKQGRFLLDYRILSPPMAIACVNL